MSATVHRFGDASIYGKANRCVTMSEGAQLSVADACQCPIDAFSDLLNAHRCCTSLFTMAISAFICGLDLNA
jgi:hypothetical protein